MDVFTRALLVSFVFHIFMGPLIYIFIVKSGKDEDKIGCVTFLIWLLFSFFLLAVALCFLNFVGIFDEHFEFNYYPKYKN